MRTLFNKNMKIKILRVSEYGQATRNIKAGQIYRVLWISHTLRGHRDSGRTTGYLIESKRDKKPYTMYEDEVEILN